jgi:hypothetical protein
MIFHGRRSSSTTQARWPWKTRVPMGGTLHCDRSNTRRSLSTTRQKTGQNESNRGMQSNYDGSMHRRYKVLKDSSRADLLNPEHEAIGGVPWVNSTIRVHILFFPLGGSDPRVVRNKE